MSRLLYGVAFSAVFFTSVSAQTSPLNNNQNQAAPDLLAQPASGPSAETSRLASLEQAVRDKPGDAVLLNNLSVRYAAAGRMDEALEMGLRSIAADGSIAATRLNLASLYDRMGMREKAHVEAAAAAALDPKSLRARSYVCDLELVLNRSREGAECYENLIADFPDEHGFPVRYGAALIMAGRLDEARSVLDQERLEDPESLNMRATLYYRLKDYEKSAALLKRAVEQSPDDPRLRYNLGMAYLAVKNRAAALSQYNLIKESSPKLAGKLYNSLYQRYIIHAGSTADGNAARPRR